MFFLDYILPFLIVLLVLVFIHELGHYLVARFNDVKIDVFSIGFGPELFGFYDRHQTRWKISLIPLGGYVKMAGDADASSRPDEEMISSFSDEERSRTLHAKTPWQRIAVSIAGPLANYLFAIVVMMGLFIWKGLPFLPPIVGGITPGMMAEKAGFQAGDRILSVNEQKVDDFEHLRNLIRETGKTGTQTVLIERKTDNETQKLTLTLKPLEGLASDKPIVWGVKPGGIDYKSINPIIAVFESVHVCLSMSVGTLQGIWGMMTRTRSADEMGGMLAIGDMASQSMKNGFASLLWFMVILSINLGLINLLPIPVLDGGAILMHFIEGVRGKALSMKVQEKIYLVGFLIVASLMLFSTWNDLVRYKVLDWITKWF